MNYLKAAGVAVILLGVVTFTGYFGTLNPFPCGSVLWFPVGLCFNFAYPVGLVLIVVGVVLEYLATKQGMGE